MNKNKMRLSASAPEANDNDKKDTSAAEQIHNGQGTAENDDIMEVEAKPILPVVPDVIDVDDSDSETETSNRNGNVTNEDESLARRRPRRRTKEVDYSAFYGESDEEEDLKLKQKEVETSSREISCSPYFFAEEKLDPKVTQLTFRDIGKVNIDDFTTFFRKNGHRIKILTFETMDLELLNLISLICPKLKSLTIKEEEEEDDEAENEETIERFKPFSKLHTLSLGFNSFLMDDNNLKILFGSVQENLRTLQYTYVTLIDLNKILKSIEDHQETFEKLQSLTITHTKERNQEDEEVLGHDEIKRISNLNLKLENLELVCGISESVAGPDINQLLKKLSPTLKNFIIAGNMHGETMADKQMKIYVPEMPHLTSFSMGSVYEFLEEVDEDHVSYNFNEPGPSSRVTPSIPVVSLLGTSLIAIEVEFLKSIPTLQSLSLGNLVSIAKITPEMFPNLRTLKIGSNWNMSLHIPVPTPGGHTQTPNFPIFQKVTELQLPDCLRDEFFASQIRNMFPKLRKITINLPGVRCLRQFFNSMSGSDLEKLYLKTQYDFAGVLESAFFAKPSHRGGFSYFDFRGSGSSTSHSVQAQVQSKACYDKLMELNNTEEGAKVLKDFIKYYNIELPIDKDDEFLASTPEGIRSLTKLKTLVIGHIPRRIKIPTNPNCPHNHPNQTYHPRYKIGFQKYPLSKTFFEKDLPELLSLETFRHGHNFDVPCNYKLGNVVSFVSHSDYNYRDKNEDNCEEIDVSQDLEPLRSNISKVLKVRIRPSTLANEQFKVKKEKKEKDHIIENKNTKVIDRTPVKTEIKNEK